MTALNSEEKRDRDGSGRYLPGHTLAGPGRPKGSAIDLRQLATDRAAERGINLDDALLDVLVALIEKAREGDVGATKLLFSRLCGEPETKGVVEIEVVGGVATPVGSLEHMVLRSFEELPIEALIAELEGQIAVLRAEADQKGNER